MSSGQANQVGAGGGVAGGAGAGGAGGQPPRQPMDRTVDDHPMTDVQFVMQRTAIRERLLEFMERKRSSSQRRHRLPKLAMHLEEILYTKFPNKNDYYNMMMGPIEPQLMFALKTFNAQKRQKRQNSQAARQAASSSSSTNTVLNHDGLCEQSASIPPMQNNNADMLDRAVSDMGLLQHQPITEDMAALSRVDQQFVMLRTAIREKIFMYIEMTPLPDEWEKQLTTRVLARRLEEVLYTKFPNKNEYYNMMNGPIVPQLLFATKTYKARKQQNQQDPQMARETASSSSGTITQDEDHYDPGLYEQFASLLADMQNENVDELVRTESLQWYDGGSDY